jgi:tetratricopeptide (TPR) repeat protein
MKIGHVCFKLGRFQEAEMWYNQSLNLQNPPNPAEVFFGLAQIQYKQKNYGKCVTSYLNLLALSPNFNYSSLCYMKLGISYEKLRDLQKAITFLEKSLEKNDLTPCLKSEVFCHLGICFTACSDNLRAFSCFDQAASFSKTFLTGICLAWKLAWADPIKSLVLCNKMTEDCEIYQVYDFKLMKAIALINVNKLDHAVLILENLWNDCKSHLVFGQYLAWAYSKVNKLDRALEVLNTLCRFWCFKVEVLLNVYVVSFRSGKMAEATDAYMKVYGIMTINGFCPESIGNCFQNALNFGVTQPKFSLSDCPLIRCPEYTTEVFHPIN